MLVMAIAAWLYTIAVALVRVRAASSWNGNGIRPIWAKAILEAE
jgi:hypothetical protein